MNRYFLLRQLSLIVLLAVACVCPVLAVPPSIGVQGKPAGKWETRDWYQLPEGKTSLDVTDFRDKVLYLYFFQSWCPGCHRVGFPVLQTVHKRFSNDPQVAFVAIQTTFEGHQINTADKLREVASRYQLNIPLGQSLETDGTPAIMRQYRSGGTPWVIIVDRLGKVRFNDYHVRPEQAIALINRLKQQSANAEPSIRVD